MDGSAVVEQPTHAIPLGVAADELFEIRERRRALEKQITALNKQYDIAEAALMARMVDEQTSIAAGVHGRVAVSESIVPAVKDWDTFHEYIYDNRFFHLLEKRASVTGCRELFEMNGQIPGVEPFTKHTLRLVTTGE